MRHQRGPWAFGGAGVLLAAALLAATGCGILGIGGDSEFVIRVDSITGPATIAPADVLTVRFWGSVGPDGCSRVASTVQGRGPGIFQIQFHGEREEKGYCTLEPVFLRHEEQLKPPFEDPFVIQARQPEGPPLEKIVRVQ